MVLLMVYSHSTGSDYYFTQKIKKIYSGIKSLLPPLYFLTSHDCKYYYLKYNKLKYNKYNLAWGGFVCVQYYFVIMKRVTGGLMFPTALLLY